MQRNSRVVITGWRALLFAPIAIPLALLAGLWPGKKTEDRSADDVAAFLKDAIEGSGGDWDWDEIANVPITNPKLDAIRKLAVLAGPPNPDLGELGRILVEAEAMAAAADRVPKTSEARVVTGERHQRDAAVQLTHLREIGWSRWDPIGLRQMSDGEWQNGGACADEYDSYLLQVVHRLRHDQSRASVVAYLEQIEIEHIGLGRSTTTKARAAATVRAIQDYIEALPQGRLKIR